MFFIVKYVLLIDNEYMYDQAHRYRYQLMSELNSMAKELDYSSTISYRPIS